MNVTPWPDAVLVRLGLSVSVAWLVVAAFWFVLRLRARARLPLLCLAVGIAATTPMIIPAAYSGARALAILLGIDAVFRAIDANRRSAEYCATPAGFLAYLRFLFPFPVLLVTGEEWAASLRARTPIRRAVRRAVTGLVLFLVSWGVLFGLQTSSLLRSSFVLDHLAKTALFAVTLEVISLLAGGLDRLTGFETGPLMNRLLIARTPAEFWLRYNTRVHAWLMRNVFRPAGAARHPMLGVALVFFVSAVFHEVAFDVALSRVDGYQFAFFMLQIPAVMVSPALERFAKRGPCYSDLARASTITWFAVTSVLFFRGIAEIFPFYYTAPMPGPVFGEWRF